MTDRDEHDQATRAALAETRQAEPRHAETRQAEPTEPSIEPAHPEIGSVVDGRYRVTRQLGEGGFGWVFAVEHVMLGQTFAMKLMNPQFAENPEWATRFQSEARTTSLIGHENIVFVTDFGQCKEYGYYLVMELLEGCSLEDILQKEGAQPLERTLDFVVAAGNALASVHEHGIVHCDLKPSNVMWVDRGGGRGHIWKLVDFGTANIVLNSVGKGTTAGTPAYMAPEQADGETVDHRADQFSFAAVTYDMLTSTVPYNTKSWLDALAEARRRKKLTPARAFNPEVTEAVDAVLARALELDPNDRYDNVEAFVLALQRAADVSLEPTLDPRDEPAAGERTPARHTEVEVEDIGGESMVIDVGEGGEEDYYEFEAAVTVTFRTVDRLRREYRRNLIAGGLFIPSITLPPLYSFVKVRIVFQTEELAVAARVVTHSVPSLDKAGGFGVHVEAKDQPKLDEFLSRLQVGVSFSAGDALRPVKAFDPTDDLSAGEAFLLTRIIAPVGMDRARQICSGLPFEFEDTVRRLIEKGYFAVDVGGAVALEDVPSPIKTLPDDVTRAPWQKDAPDEAPEPEFRYSNEEIERILDLSDQFKAQRSYMAAIDVLRTALELSATVPQFYERLANLHAEFTNDLPRAFKAIYAAIQLDPHNDTYHVTLARLQDLLDD